jgi:PTH1 family peptidyl-tRNA hydrolase
VEYKLIAGLGNYPEKYVHTRHNVGYDFIDYYKKKNNISDGFSKKFDSLFFSIKSSDETVFFIKPQTYMNLSGKTIQSFASYFKIKPENILVIYDDVDINTGEFKINKSRGCGGHNGISSIIEALGKDFYRIRIGIKNSYYSSASKTEFVLAKFSEDEIKIMYNNIYTDVEKVVKDFIDNKIVNSMNKYNRKKNG